MFSRRADESSQRRNPPRPSAFATHLFATLLLVVLVVAKHGFAQIAPADEQENTVRGTVVNSVTQAPVPRALVFSPDQRFAMLTDSEGHFEFTIPKTNSENENTNAATGITVPDPPVLTAAGLIRFSSWPASQAF